jgi:flagellar motor switch protein FliN
LTRRQHAPGAKPAVRKRALQRAAEGKIMSGHASHDHRRFDPQHSCGQELNVTIELGRTEMALEDVLKLRSGAIVPLDNQAGDPVDVIVNGRLAARGEVVVVEDTFCVRIVELVAATKAA